MSNPSNVEGSRLATQRNLDIPAEVSSDQDPKNIKHKQLPNQVDRRNPKRKKRSARDILAILSGRRITITEIKFTEKSPQNGGTYADVAVARLVKTGQGDEEGRKVAVKKLRFIINGDMTEEKFLRVFVNELRLLTMLDCPNIVKIIGFVEDTKNRIAWLVFPWEENGNLREFLRTGTWEIPERMSLIRDVAAGVGYLHSCKPPICHGDLKSLNILVNSSNRAVITDFGSARVIREVQTVRADRDCDPAPSTSQAPTKEWSKHPEFKITISDNTAFTLTGPTCSLRWAPPEFFYGDPLDLASDIWALGWIAWEAITDRYPFEELALEVDVTMKVMEGQLPQVHNHEQLSQVHLLCGFMQSCWKPDPKERPSVLECWRTIQWIPYAIPVSKKGEENKIRSAVLLLQIGEMHRLQGRHDEAAKMYEQGLVIARSAGSKITEGNILSMLGHNSRQRSELVEAEAFFSQALAINESIGHHHGRAIALDGLGQVQQLRYNYFEAMASHTEAVAMHMGLGDFLGQANALRGLGDVHRACFNSVESEMFYSQALALYKGIGEDMGRAYCSLDLAKIRLDQAQYGEAKALIDDAARISERTNYPWGKMTSKEFLEKLLEAEGTSSEPQIVAAPPTTTIADDIPSPGPLPEPNPSTSDGSF